MPSPSETKTGPESGSDRPNWKVVEIHGSDEGGEFSEFLIADHDASEGAIMRREEAVYGQVADRQTADIVVKAVNSWPDLVECLRAFPGFPDDAKVGDPWVERKNALLDKLGARS